MLHLLLLLNLLLLLFEGVLHQDSLVVDVRHLDGLAQLTGEQTEPRGVAVVVGGARGVVLSGVS